MPFVSEKTYQDQEEEIIMEILGIDIGGSGIKGVPVETETGELLYPRHRIPTPELGKPKPMAKVVAAVAQHFDWLGPIGCGFPAVIHDGVVHSAANIHKRWIGTDAASLFAKATCCDVLVLNDADAAGLAEMTFGAGRGRKGVVLVVTIGTGLGTTLFTGGHLVPNMEFGHVEINGEDAELRASDAARKRENLSWKKWSRRLDRYLITLERLLSPDLIILGGGVSKRHEMFLPRLSVQTEVVPALLGNQAGIIGAALAAQEMTERER
jgi:polyphosphate glucokinase